MRTTLHIPDPLFISAPNDGGLLYAHRHLLMPMLHEDATGMSLTADGLLWCVQTAGNPLLREVRQGQFHALELANSPLDLHDVLVDASGTYVVFTETNEVARLDHAFRVAECWRFGEEPDSAHVNCIVIQHGRLLASMFGPFASHRGYKGETRGAGRVIDVRSGEVLIDDLSQPHSLVAVGEQLWLCSSEDRTLQIYDREFKLERTLALPGYTRGLAVGAHAVYVGLSRSRNLKSGEVGQFASAVVAVLDRQSLAITGYLPLPWNEVYDIRIAPAADIVTDVMASIWAHERVQHGHALQADADELDRTRELARAELTAARMQAAERLQEVQLQAAQDLQLVQQHGLTMEAAWKQAHQRAEALQAQLIASRGETVKRDARIHALEQMRDELQLVKSSRSWRLTRPLRFITRLIQQRGLSMEDRRKLMRLPPLQVVTAPAQAEAGVVHGGGGSESPATSCQDAPTLAQVLLTEPPDSQRDFFVWAVIDWHFRIQRPQHLARELAAAGHRVFYISNNFIDHTEPGFQVEALDGEGRLFQLRLHLQGSPMIYHASPGPAEREQLRAGVALVLAWTRSRACASLVQHPYWLETAQVVPNHKLVYDCMDHHGGFADNSDEVLEREHELMREADLLVVTSDWLHEEVGQYNPRRMMIRNACQYEHFSHRPERIFSDPQGRKVIGYYGAIAEWFDLDLLEKLARRFSDCLVLLVGADTCGAKTRLQALGNVHFTGEVAYASLPYYLEGFDVCLLPFQVIPLTLATNPVKVYEYLSAGKDVVSIELPEIRQFGELVRTAVDHAGFLDAVGEALQAAPDPALVARRRQFAAGQTWAHRAQDLVQGLATLAEPRVSVVVVTYNNLDLTRACLDSVARYSDYANLEVIVVDNASSDDTPAFLAEWAAGGRDRQIVLNPDNRGFAAANNQGLALASGDFLVLLNNDTYVTPGWVATLASHLRRNEKLGMLGPVTNNIGNEARIEIRYDDMAQMLRAAGVYTRSHAGQLTPLRTAAFFCVMLRRAVYEKVGPLDEVFGIGFFEDDDYCRRVEQAGWSIACADDVFVHHNLSASFNKLKQETRQTLFEQNKATYEAKWGPWVPHRYRDR